MFFAQVVPADTVNLHFTLFAITIFPQASTAANSLTKCYFCLHLVWKQCLLGIEDMAAVVVEEKGGGGILEVKEEVVGTLDEDEGGGSSILVKYNY